MVIKHVKILLFNRSFFLGFLFSIGLFAKYIFSTGNLYEDVKLVVDKGVLTEQSARGKDNGTYIHKDWYYKW